jgi:diguanylate cyclase (GGDEF)-like protein/PAS domain S-box-containing protein
MSSTPPSSYNTLDPLPEIDPRVPRTDTPPPPASIPPRFQHDSVLNIVEAVSSGVVMIDSAGTIVLVNSETERMFGYGRDELVGNPVEMLMPVRFRGGHERHRMVYFANPIRRDMGTGRELFGCRKDGSEFPIEIGLSSIDSDRGPLAVASVMDISSRRELEESFRNVVEVAPYGLAIVDADGRIVVANEFMARTFGYTREELLALPIEQLMPERYRRGHVRQRAIYEEAPVVREMGVNRDLVALHKDGTEFGAEIGLSPVLWKGKPLTLATVTDISVRQLYENELKRATARLKQLSLFDNLTGLPNRVLLFDRLDQALHTAKRSGTGFAVMMIDLNLFKEINDTLGHAAGDELLATIGRRFAHLTRDTDTFARIGGDEFAALLAGCDSPGSAIVVAEKIHTALDEPVTIGDVVLRVTAAIGVALYPGHGTDPRALLVHADQAMYVAKRSSRSCEVYTPDGVASRAFLIACNLPEALERREFYLEYQPKLHLATRSVVGVEALVRWRHPRFGSIPPDDFIGVAERTSIIKPMTYAILEMALDQAARWQEAGLYIPVAVNLSARMVDNHDLTNRTCAALAARGLSPDLLTYEVTETALMASPLRVQESLRSLRQAGIGISIDDFGAGYTSLKYLRDFMISEIKIDRMFVTRLTPTSRDVAIVRSIATLGHGFSVKIVAEGIENADQVDLLLQLGCSFGQGYALGRPMSVEQFETWRMNHVPISSGKETTPDLYSGLTCPACRGVQPTACEVCAGLGTVTKEQFTAWRARRP